jgi:maleylacetate reductase
VSRLYRFGPGAIDQVGPVAQELALRRLLLVTTKRARAQADAIPAVCVYDGVRSHVPAETVADAVRLAREKEVDGLVALGGGSAIDTAKAMTVALLEQGQTVKTIAVPTTYAAAEWTPFFGVRDEQARRKGGGSNDLARPVAAIYDPQLTLDLPPADTAGTALNALAHCAEALYVKTRSAAGDRDAVCGATAISYALPRVLARPSWLYARSRLLEGAMRSAWALDNAGLALGHAMAQALGGRYGLPHGALNAVCLPPALRFNQPAAPEALERLAAAMGAGDAIARVEELARLGGYARLRDLGVPEDELGEVAAAAAERAGAKANPRPASPAEIEELLRSVW